MQLDVVRDLLVGSLDTDDRLEGLIYSAIYLKVLFMGANLCCLGHKYLKFLCSFFFLPSKNY